MIAEAGSCQWCGCHFRTPVRAMYHRCTAMREAETQWTEVGDGIAVLATETLTAEEKDAMREYVQHHPAADPRGGAMTDTEQQLSPYQRLMGDVEEYRQKARAAKNGHEATRWLEAAGESARAAWATLHGNPIAPPLAPMRSNQLPGGPMKSDNKHIARMEEIGSRLAVDADGCVWWVHSDGTHSMVRTNPDNNPTPMPFTFYARAPTGLTSESFEPRGVHDLRPVPGTADTSAEERAERAEMVDGVMRAAGLE